MEEEMEQEQPGFFEGLGEQADEIAGGVSEGIAGLWGGITQGAEDAWNATTDFVGEQMANVAGFADDATDYVQESYAETGEFLAEAGADAVGTTVGVASEGSELLSEGLAEVGELAQDGGEDLSAWGEQQSAEDPEGSPLGEAAQWTGESLEAGGEWAAETGEFGDNLSEQTGETGDDIVAYDPEFDAPQDDYVDQLDETLN
ncbi:hypothetical protein [Gloeobacter morelensis]|uniref:Uncharacterized protein n=1 Tax=Gloeobacter morelensis MG652769 TaxID=2781736 RepID=A0ABY3PQB4_9CYAN|nr:hypothetical protein [Gloeobacter morelensis]UFP95903.1 hypothetical protein ISF26_06690 [Gloeobacter morelensis MG652769]